MGFGSGLRALALGAAMVCGAASAEAVILAPGTYQLQKDGGGDFQNVGLYVSLNFTLPTIPAPTDPGVPALYQYYATGNVTWTSGVTDFVFWAAYPTILNEGSTSTSTLMAWYSNGFAATPCRYVNSCHAFSISPTIDSIAPTITLGQSSGHLASTGGSADFTVGYNVYIPEGYSLIAPSVPGPIAGPELPGCGPSGGRPPKCDDGTVGVPGPIAGAGLPALMALSGFMWARRRKASAA
jgi:hypothetical protein